MSYHPVIGIETHIQLNTKTKLFCSCLNEYAPEDPNKNICPFCTGQPGALPRLNKSAVLKALKFGVALRAKIPNQTRWDRKNYFYPDLPAGYQISQYDNPIVEEGELKVWIENQDGTFYTKIINIERAHLEADAGKLLHLNNKTLVDYNRSGAPLIECVTKPVIRNGSEAMSYVSELQLLVRRLEISEADMDKGQMRFDVNISLQNDEQFQKDKLPPYKVEIKNINSIRSIGRAIEFEILRQTKILEAGDIPVQETRGWRDDLNKSEGQRSKEDAMDYRYFPEPDLRILNIESKYIPKYEDLGSLPSQTRQNYLDMGLSYQNANTFVTQKDVGTLFDAVIQNTNLSKNIANSIANLITTNIIGLASKMETPINQVLKPEIIKDLAILFADRKISNQGLAKAIDYFINQSQQKDTNEDQTVEETVKNLGLIQINDDGALQAFVDLVIDSNPSQVEEYKSGKVELLRYFVGQCMKESKGKGDPKKFSDLLEEKLAS